MTADTHAPQRPHFAVELDLWIGGHDDADLAAQLRRLADKVDRGELGPNGFSGHWHYIRHHDPAMTRERFDAEVEAWAAARRASKPKDAPLG